jgi:hypothetical protein
VTRELEIELQARLVLVEWILENLYATWLLSGQDPLGELEAAAAKHSALVERPYGRPTGDLELMAGIMRALRILTPTFFVKLRRCVEAELERRAESGTSPLGP